MATPRLGLVVDASVAAKWHLQDEGHAAEATRLLRGFEDGTITLVAPSLIRYEIGNALELARRSGRIDSAEVKVQLDKFLELAPQQDHDDDTLIVAASALASEHGIEIYDGIYLALSSLLGIPMITADAKLYRRVGGVLPNLLWLGDLDLAT